MTDEFIRSFDDVYLIYPLNNRFYDEPRGIFLPVRHMDCRVNIAVSDPEYPHMLVKYFFNSHHKKRLKLWQRDELNYYKQERRWVLVSFEKQRSKEI